MVTIVDKARNLRRSQTDSERKLWARLRNRNLGGYKFKRQYPMPPFIVDFFCEEKGIIVEIDGGQHTPEKDGPRTRELEKRGFRIVRFGNNEVMDNIDGVLLTLVGILEDLAALTPHPTLPRAGSAAPPSPKGEGLKRTYLGKIATAHGVRGLVKVLCAADDPRLFDAHGPVFTSEDGNDTLALSMKNSMGKYWLAEVEGVADRDAALAIAGTELWIGRDKLPAIETGNEYYIDDLIGLRAIDGEGNTVGTVIAVANYGAGDLLEIQPEGASSFYLPMTAQYVGAIDDQTIAVTVPEELR